MKKEKRIAITISGGLVSLLIVGGIVFAGAFFFQLHKSYFPIPETKDYILIYATMVGVIVGILAVYFLMRKRYKYFARGIFTGLLIVFPILYITTEDLAWYLTPEPFDSKAWKSEPDKPLEMVYSIIRNDTILIGKTKEEALTLLGTDIIEEYSDDSTLTYHLDYGRISHFRVAFDGSGTVKRAYYTYYD